MPLCESVGHNKLNKLFVKWHYDSKFPLRNNDKDGSNDEYDRSFLCMISKFEACHPDAVGIFLESNKMQNKY